MTTRELLNHTREQIEIWSRARARSAYMGDSILCNILNRHNLYVDPLNYDMSPWLILDGFWELPTTMAIGRAIQPGWTCLDVGAWCGYYSVLMADLVGSTGRVMAYEPNPKHQRLCEHSFKANGHDWARCSPLAISDKHSQAAFLLTDGGGSRLDVSGTETVYTQTIDQLELSRIDLIKMDIEGGERDAWDGMQQTIDKNPNIIIVMEWDARRYPDAQQFADMIAKRFLLRYITDEGLTTNITVDDLLKPVMRNLWLQR